MDHYDDFENSIYAFLQNNDFITREDDKYKLTVKGQMADQFSEINPIIFVNDMDYILKEDVLETLSMFIDTCNGPWSLVEIASIHLTFSLWCPSNFI